MKMKDYLAILLGSFIACLIGLSIFLSLAYAGFWLAVVFASLLLSGLIIFFFKLVERIEKLEVIVNDRAKDVKAPPEE